MLWRRPGHCKTLSNSVNLRAAIKKFFCNILSYISKINSSKRFCGPRCQHSSIETAKYHILFLVIWYLGCIPLRLGMFSFRDATTSVIG